MMQSYHQKVRMQCVGYIRDHQDEFQHVSAYGHCNSSIVAKNEQCL